MHANVLNRRCREALLGVLLFSNAGQAAEFPKTGFTNAMVLTVQNKVEVARRGAETWDPAYVTPTNQVLYPGDRLRTGLESRALLRLSDRTDFPLGELTQVELAAAQQERTVVKLLRGLLYFFHRDRPGEFQVDTPTVSAVVRGTEFNLEVANDGTTTFHMVDGAVELN